ncbi:carboxypeptidase-like regulatory domain-containing protein [Rasiella rasia]|uniref:Carboxypeptidase-like regulatory domain-containing protein n=1 Tax=Rasiella rasia TaxID=2744027 RepID=A0A6G6GPD8_9FLAO|nr:carboxypeptidase-like regulatory domain-containing protein [Rasiella rasia]QIE60465.1 carboxypeptidase-like regulatory domain-containing protein [Rasiella rasia]
MALLLLLVVQVAGQEVSLQGKITNLEDIEGIHVLNTTSRYNAVTDAFGNFSITAKPLDTLLFSSVHYLPKKVEISEEIQERGIIVITLEKLINELDEVFLGSKLTGDLDQDIKNINVKKTINFKDVGIPGFEGEPEEKIPTVIGQTIGPTHINIDALYKHISGYYKKLRIQRKWEAENQTVASILYKYDETFFERAYGIPKDRTYDFLLFCIETSTLQADFRKQGHARVLGIFKKQAAVYLERIDLPSEKKE